jgi:hypothetical protein
MESGTVSVEAVLPRKHWPRVAVVVPLKRPRFVLRWSAWLIAHYGLASRAAAAACSFRA